MDYTTNGIVLHHFKYGEKSVIVKVYTKKYGIQSYIINNVTSKKKGNKTAYLQPLSLVELTAFKKGNKGLQQLKSIKLSPPFQEIPFQIYKTSIAFFLAEILYKSIKEEEENDDLFEFLYHSIQILDLEKENYMNFHLVFICQLTKYLGFFPENIKQSSPPLYFDLREGVFLKQEPYHQFFLSPSISADLYEIFNSNFDSATQISINTLSRKKILNALLNYYSLHVSNFNSLKSKEVLEEILN